MVTLVTATLPGLFVYLATKSVESGALIWLLTTGYLMPAFIAELRRHKNTGAILVLNLGLGWTFIGWIAALVWAVAN